MSADQLHLLCVRCSAPYQCDPPYCCAWCRIADGTCPCRFGRQWSLVEEGPLFAVARAAAWDQVLVNVAARAARQGGRS